MVVKGSEDAGEVDNGVDPLDDDFLLCLGIGFDSVAISGEVTESVKDESDETVGIAKGVGSLPGEAFSSAAGGL